MSEPKLITPLLENHIMGDPISDHHGVRCCPALTRDTDEKYIVKLISIPATQVQLDAMLLTGICAGEDDAREYFREQAEDVIREAQLLQKLSRLEGFKAYKAWQIEPMDDAVGYDVYLLGEYCMTLARQLQQNNMTHLGAVNLGLDLCAALDLCRRNGYLYVNLKPENVYITENREFRIADIGFVSLDSLKYISLPDKYRSSYTAPEIADAYSALNTTMDIYAAGLILYQAFNGGILPEISDQLPSPAYADYEMSSIILKACAASPEDRWQDPQEMGQALIAYMQTNTVNDTPIIPVPEPEPETPVEAAEPFENDAAEEPPMEPSEEISPESDSEVEENTDIQPESQPESEIPEPEPPQPMDELEEAEQFVIDGFIIDDTQAVAAGDEDPFSEEVSQMLAQADELIAHKAPDPVVAPEPVDVPIPDPILPEPEPEPEIPMPTELSQPEETDPEPAPEAIPQTCDNDPEELSAAPQMPSRKKMGGLISALVTVLVILLLAAAGFFYHQNYYLQPINGVTVQVDEDRAVVTLDTEIDNSLLTVVCTDIYGNSRQQKAENNTAVFTSLNAGTSYKITLVIDGHHKLTGNTTASFSTAAQTNIVTFTAIAADSDGSVILNFSVQGPDSKNWFVYYSTDDEAERSVPCSGHMATITGLTVGSTYTFRLVPETDLYIVGNETLTYTALPVIYAQNLSIHGYDSGKLIVTWTAPEGISVDSWTVRCYNTEGFDFTATVTDTQIAIEGLDPSMGYTVDVKAAGMSVSKWTSITANSITFKDLTLDDTVPGKLTITWSYEGIAPADGWQLQYTVNGTDYHLVPCEDTSAVISPLIPGAQYSFSFLLPADITVFGGTAQYTAPNLEFSFNGVTAAGCTFRMCWTPENEDWRWYYLWERDFTNTFAPGERASFVIHADGEILPGEQLLETLFIIRNSNGTIYSITVGKTLNWQTMWDRNYAELDMPIMPTDDGEYTVQIYFNQQYVITVPFAIVSETIQN